jgi:SAM-dependent methyltransferase
MNSVDLKNCPETPVINIIHSIGHIGENIVGLDLGTGDGTNLLALLHNCPNIKTIHGVDCYKPWTDYLKIPYDGTISVSLNEFEMELLKTVSLTRRKYAVKSDRIVFHEKSSVDALEDFEDGSLDFIFVNSYSNLQTARADVANWWPKLKEGGIMYGNSWECYPVQKAVNEFRFKNNIETTLVTYNNIWSFRKQIKAE